jgi:putative flippase GtrA
LAVGAVATALDIAVLLLCVHRLGMTNPEGAMAGVAVGAAFAFFANRHFAFRDRNPHLVPQAAKYVAATAAAMVVHAGFVWLLADRLGAPVVIAKLIADLAVFSAGQLLVLRYLVFPRRGPGAASP